MPKRLSEHNYARYKRHLGTTVGCVVVRDEFVPGKVKTSCKEIELLSKVALSQPHAAFTA